MNAQPRARRILVLMQCACVCCRWQAEQARRAGSVPLRHRTHARCPELAASRRLSKAEASHCSPGPGWRTANVVGAAEVQGGHVRQKHIAQADRKSNSGWGLIPLHRPNQTPPQAAITRCSVCQGKGPWTACANTRRQHAACQQCPPTWNSCAVAAPRTPLPAGMIFMRSWLPHLKATYTLPQPCFSRMVDCGGGGWRWCKCGVGGRGGGPQSGRAAALAAAWRRHSLHGPAKPVERLPGGGGDPPGAQPRACAQSRGTTAWRGWGSCRATCRGPAGACRVHGAWRGQLLAGAEVRRRTQHV